MIFEIIGFNATGPDELYMDYHGTIGPKMGSLETMYKVRLLEFVFLKTNSEKYIKGYTVTEFKELFVQRNSGRQKLHTISRCNRHGRV